MSQTDTGYEQIDDLLQDVESLGGIEFIRAEMKLLYELREALMPPALPGHDETMFEVIERLAKASKAPAVPDTGLLRDETFLRSRHPVEERSVASAANHDPLCSAGVEVAEAALDSIVIHHMREDKWEAGGRDLVNTIRSALERAAREEERLADAWDAGKLQKPDESSCSLCHGDWDNGRMSCMGCRRGVVLSAPKNPHRKEPSR